jgi:hypothetical protein
MVKTDKGKRKFKKPRKGTTESGGKVTISDLPPGVVEVTWKSPARLISWEEEKATKLKAKLKKAFKVEFVWPKSEEADEAKRIHEQLVNHKPDKKKEHPEYGHKIKVRIKVVDDDGPSVKRELVYVKAEYDAAKLSKRNKPKRAIAKGKKFSWADHGKRAMFTKDGGEATFDLELGYAGNDEVILRIGGTEACDDQMIKIVNKRKLYYQVTHRDTLAAKPAMARQATTLDEVGVVYEETSTVKFKEGDKGVPKGTFFDGAMVGKAGRQVNIGDHNKKWFHTKLFKNTKKPLGVHVLFCDIQFDGGSKKHHTQTHQPTLTTAVSARIPCTGGKHVFEKALQDEKDCVLSATWTSKAPKGHEMSKKKNKSGKLDRAWIKIDHNADGTGFKIELPTANPDDLGNKVGDGTPPAGKTAKDPETKHPIKCKIKLKVADGEYLGEADGKVGYWQLIAVNSVSTTNDVMSHELGHTMNQVVYKVAPGLKKTDHTRRYTGKGHTGAHCAEGMSQADFDSLANYGSVAACKCIMYGENSGSASLSDGHFCVQCKPFIMGEQLTTL